MKYSTRTFYGIFAALLLVTAVGAQSCSKQGKKEGDNAQPEAVPVSTVTVAQELIDLDEVFTATIEPFKSNNISSQMGGRIKRIATEVGNTVAKGQVLAEMDNSQLTQMKVKLEDARLSFARTDELYKIGGISKAQWDAARSAKTIAETAYTNMYENTVLRSPISGVVTARNYDAGDLASPQLPIFVVEQLDPVKVRINASEKDFPSITKGQKAIVTASTLGDESFEATVSLISPTLDPMSHTFGVELSVNNKGKQLRPGMYAKVKLNFGQSEAILIPDRAVIKQVGSGERYVYILNGSKAERRTVTIGRQIEDRVEVTDGLTPGEVVIVEGSNRLNNGTTVKVTGENSNEAQTTTTKEQSNQ